MADKNRDRNKRKQKAAAKSRKRAAQKHKAHTQTRPKKKTLFFKAPSLEVFTFEDHTFWLAHGCNYLASNHAEGVWEPLFDSIYWKQRDDGSSERDTVTPEQIARHILNKYKVHERGWAGHLGKPKILMAWSIQNRDTVWTYYQVCLQKLREKDPDCDAPTLAKQPHNAVVWGVFNNLEAELAKKNLSGLT